MFILFFVSVRPGRLLKHGEGGRACLE